MNYEIQLEQTTKVFHVNLLKRWYKRKESDQEQHSFSNIIEESNEIVGYHWEQEEPTMGSQLDLEQQQEIKRALQCYPEIIRGQLGLTRSIEHRIVTGENRALRQRPYRIPPALKTAVTEELKTLLDQGLVEESTSEWSSPLVIVKKKDGGNHMCRLQKGAFCH